MVGYNLLDISYDRIDYYRSKKYLDLLPSAYQFLLSNIIVLYKSARYGGGTKKDINKIKSIYKKEYKNCFKHIKFSLKIKYLLFYLFPEITLKIYIRLQNV